mmetsp:Transcript_72529/g.170581  ORF Transcript_72529/g.170581 Transcript_72529/m.170581 type:complete len:202 (+) Transcript_72529:331-936(+)
MCKEFKLLMGHSLGEFSALAVSGAVSVGDAALVVAKRGRAMQAAADALGVPGKMAVLLLARRDEVQNVLKEQGDFVQIASVNSPKQIVISGPASRVDTAVKEIKDRKFARRVRELDVSAPFHCDVMVPAAQELAELLDSIDIKQPQIPIVSFCQAGAAAQAVRAFPAAMKASRSSTFKQSKRDWLNRSIAPCFGPMGLSSA